MAIVATYRGKKNEAGEPLEYLSGVPARSLTQDDLDALTKEEREAVAASSLYKMADAPKAAPERASAPAAESKNG